MRERALLWGPVVFQMAVIFAASSIPNVQRLPGGVSDKLWHVAGYGFLGVLLVRALSRGRWADVTLATSLLAVAIAGAYGVSDEWHQSFVPGRAPDAGDVYADTLGAAAAVGLAWAWAIIRRFSARRQRRGSDRP